jgi:ketosteroid isomerase-like protein
MAADRSFGPDAKAAPTPQTRRQGLADGAAFARCTKRVAVRLMGGQCSAAARVRRDTGRAMSRGENVEVENVVVRRCIWAFENDTDAFRDTLHPDIEWFPIEEDRTPSYGIEAALRNRSQWFETWGEHRLDLEEVIEGGDSVVLTIHITARGKTSGVEVDIRFYAHFRVQDDKVIYIFDHEDRAAALKAAGLSD